MELLKAITYRKWYQKILLYTKKVEEKLDNSRLRHRHIKTLKVDYRAADGPKSQMIHIDLNKAEVENKMAIKCCQDNDKAFYNHKEKKLFPTSGNLTALK